MMHFLNSQVISPLRDRLNEMQEMAFKGTVVQERQKRNQKAQRWQNYLRQWSV